MLLEFEQAKIIQIDRHTHDTNKYWLEYVDRASLDFIAGQFVTLDLPISEHKRDRWRSYSIANAPDQTNVIELLIKKYENGKGGSMHIHKELKLDSVVNARPPQGHFILPSYIGPQSKLLYICTGVGVAPFHSMILDMYVHQKPINQIDLVFGTRRQEDLLYYDEFTLMSQQWKPLNYHVRLSREEWHGKPAGRVEEEYPSLVEVDNANQHIFICGWRDMIDTVRMNLKDMGVPKERIHFELYG